MEEEKEPLYLKGANEDSKKMLAYLLRYMDEHMVEVVGEKNEFVAYCKDEERGDIIFSINAFQPNREKDKGNSGKVTDVNVNPEN